MKKIIYLFIIMLVFITTGCGKVTTNIEGSLEDLMTKVYSNIPDDEKPMALMNTVVDEEKKEYFLGSKNIEYDEALASESAIGSIAHSVVLLRAKDGANINKIKEEIRNNVDPRKWICVEVNESDIIVENKGNLIILIMVENETTRTKLINNFKKLN